MKDLIYKLLFGSGYSLFTVCHIGNKRTVFMQLLLLITVSASAQEHLQANLNMFRSGDEVLKQQIEYKTPGRSGEDVLWDISRMKIVNKKYRLAYINASNNIVGTEHNTMYYYTLRNDSLLSNGYENNNTKVSYISPCLIMKYITKLGDMQSGYFDGCGNYCGKTFFRSYGSYKLNADANGLLILPEGDTLKNVLRIHTMKLVSEQPINGIGSELAMRALLDSIGRYTNDSISIHLSRDSNVIAINTYQWYAMGYRYPVFESTTTGRYKNGKQSEQYTTSYYYPPSEQKYLVDDLDNRKVRDSLARHDNGRGGTSPDVKFIYNVHQYGNDGNVNFEYYTDRPATISYGIYTTSGITLYQSGSQRQGAGTYQGMIDINQYRRGVYLLTFIVNGKTYTEKIYKKE